MLKPDLYLTSVLELNLKILKKIGVFAIILDVDNTIRVHKKNKPFDGVLEWVKYIQNSGILIVISSNNVKKNIEPIAEFLNLDFVSLSFKPFPIGLKKAAKKLGNLRKKDIAVVGDQFFTDIVGGKILGFKTILIKPIEKEEGFFWKIRRGLEKIILNKIMWWRQKIECDFWPCW